MTIEFATWSAEPFAYLDCLYIREPHLGVSAARTCFGQCCGFCAVRRCRLAEWQTPVDNPLSIGFYPRMGEQAMREIRFRYEIDTQEAAC